MDVRLDQPGTGEAAFRVMDRRVGRDAAFDRGDAAVRDADVERLPCAVGEPRVADDEVKRHAPQSTLMFGVLDDRRPLVQLGLEMRGERRRALLVGGRDFLAEIAQALLHRRIGQRLQRGGAELADRLGRRALRRPQPEPGRDVDAGRAGLVHRRDVGRGGKPRLAGDRIGAHLSAAHERQRADRLIERQIDVPGGQVAHHVGRARAIRHEGEARAGHLLEIDAADMLARSGAAGAGGQLARVRLDVGDQLLQVLRRQVLLADHDVGIVRQLRDRLEVLRARRRAGSHRSRSPPRMTASCRAPSCSRPPPRARRARRRSCPMRRSRSRPAPSARAALRMRSATMRASASVGPPAPNGTIMVTGRDG